MKQVIKENTVNETVYEAIDGQQFKDSAQCEKYEESAICLLRYKYNKLVINSSSEENIFGLGSCDNNIDIIKVNNKQDIDLVLQLVCYFGSRNSLERSEKILINAMNENDYVFIGTGYEWDYFWVIDSLKEYCKKLENQCKKNETN